MAAGAGEIPTRPVVDPASEVFLPTFPPTFTPTITNTPTIGPTPTVTNTPTVTGTPTATPTFVQALDECKTEGLNSIAATKAIATIAADESKHVNVCEGPNQELIRCALIQPPTDPLPNEGQEVGIHLKKIFVKKIQPATPPGAPSISSCSDAGKKCVTDGGANDSKGRTILGYALRYGDNALAKEILLYCGGAQITTDESVRPRDNALTAMLMRVLDVGRDCKANPPEPVTGVDLAVRNRLNGIALLFAPPPNVAPFPISDYVSDPRLPDPAFDFHMNGKVMVSPPEDSPTAPGETLIPGARARFALFAAGGGIKAQQDSQARGVVDLLRKIWNKCPAARTSVTGLYDHLWRRGAGFPPLDIPSMHRASAPGSEDQNFDRMILNTANLPVPAIPPTHTPRP